MRANRPSAQMSIGETELETDPEIQSEGVIRNTSTCYEWSHALTLTLPTAIQNVLFYFLMLVASTQPPVIYAYFYIFCIHS